MRFEPKFVIIWSENFQMIPEPSQKQIVDQANAQIQKAMNSCTEQILTDLKKSFDSCSKRILISLEKSFGSLNHLHRQKESEKDKIISLQKATIEQLKPFKNLMDGFASIMNSKNISSDAQIQHKNTVDQKLRQSEPTIPSRTQMIQQEKGEIQMELKLVEEDKVQKNNYRSKSQEKVKQQQQNHARRKNSKDKQKKNERKINRIKRGINKVLNKQKPLLKPRLQQNNKNFQRVKFKPPLQCRYKFLGVAFTPNLTRLSFIQYEYAAKKQKTFNEKQVGIISKYDLKDVTAVAISFGALTNSVLSLFMDLKMENLRSLRIQSNNITDLRPLKNLNLNILQDLDVSGNPLGVESALFLAANEFNELIYLTVSFETGVDDSHWEILLKNQMKNYPKLQALDVCNENELNSATKKAIENCMSCKSQYQKLHSGQNGYPFYPENYQIKITWNESLDVYATYSKEKKYQINKRWQISVNQESWQLEKPDEKNLRKQFNEANGLEKRKGIKKTRGRRGTSRNRVRKMDERNQESEDSDQSFKQ